MEASSKRCEQTRNLGCLPLCVDLQGSTMASWTRIALYVFLGYVTLRVLRTFLRDNSVVRGQAVIITGSSSGIGRAVAIKLHAMGVDSTEPVRRPSVHVRIRCLDQKRVSILWKS